MSSHATDLAVYAKSSSSSCYARVLTLLAGVRFEVQRHCELRHAGLAVRWTGLDSSPGVAAQSTISADRLRAGVTLRQSAISWDSVADRSTGVTLRQPTIAECIGGAKRPARPTTSWDTDDDDDDDDDDSDDSEVCQCFYFFY